MADDGPQRLRADAARNHERLLAAARDVFVLRGPSAPLEDIAKRAGVGIGTLYRRFADRDALMRAVVVDALQHTRAVAEEAETEPTGFDGLKRYMHAVLDIGTAAVIPVLIDFLDLDGPELGPARAASAAGVERLVERAHEDGSLAKDITFGDIATFVVRLSRPLPGPIPDDLNRQLAHRHLDLLINGLRPQQHDELSGEGLSLADLRALRER